VVSAWRQSVESMRGANAQNPADGVRCLHSSRNLCRMEQNRLRNGGFPDYNSGASLAQ